MVKLQIVPVIVLGTLTLLVASLLDAGPPKPAVIHFDGDVYTLKFQDTNRVGVVNEYIIPSETLSDWSRMIGLHHYYDWRDHQGAARALADSVRATAVWGPVVTERKGDDRVVLEFAVAADGRFLEFNIFILQEYPKGKGILMHQFAERAYGGEARSYLQGLNDRRESLVPKVLNYEFPALVAPTKSVQETPDFEIHQPTPETRLELKPLEKDSYTYQLHLQGGSAGQRFYLWMKSLGESPRMIPDELALNASGRLEVVTDGRRSNVTFGFRPETFARGEPIQIAVTSADRTILAFTELVPTPLESVNDSGQRISMILHTKSEYRVAVDGFAPMETVGVVASAGRIVATSHPVGSGKEAELVVPASGFLSFRWVASETWNRLGGEATLAVTGQDAAVTVDFPWGTSISSSNDRR